MRTTINLDDEVFRAYKQRAAKNGTTFAQEVEEALRAELHPRADSAAQERYEVPVFRGGDGSPALVDINDNKALWELMDEEDHAGGRW